MRSVHTHAFNGVPNNNNNTIWGGHVLTGEEPPPHSGELKHDLTQEGGPTQSQLSRPVSSRHHISMEHRLRRKHLLLNPDTNARKEKKEKHQKKERTKKKEEKKGRNKEGKEASKGWYPPRRAETFFLKEMLQEIVTKLRLTDPKNQILSPRQKETIKKEKEKRQRK